jgi:hypothetical protein
MASMRTSLAHCTAWAVFASAAAFGQAPVSGGINEQPLAQALSEFAQHTGLQVVYVSEIVGGRHSNPVRWRACSRAPG